MKEYICKNCLKKFLNHPSRRAKFCSVACARIKQIKKGFPRGNTPWNKGIHYRSNLPKPWKILKNEKNVNWKGNKVGYRGLHSWVERNLGKPYKCENCGLEGLPIGKKRFFQWANKSRQYLRDLTDWVRLCILCHKRYDSKTS